MTDQVKHVAHVYYGDWSVFAYCITEGCGWRGLSTTLWAQDNRDAEGNNHDDRARSHEREMNGGSHTELGFAAWKDSPSMVRRAREVAAANIAIATLRREALKLVAPFMGWLTSKLTRKAQSHECAALE